MPAFPFDSAISHTIQSFQPSWLTSIMKDVSLIAAPELLAIIFLVIAGYFFYQRDALRGIKLLLLLSGNILTPILKALIARPRPSADQIFVLTHNSGYGFPSGHALGVVIFCFSLSLISKKPLSIVSWLVLTLCILVVGYSRVYLGAHWASDIFAGFFVGLLWVAVCRVLLWPYTEQGVQTKTASK